MSQRNDERYEKVKGKIKQGRVFKMFERVYKETGLDPDKMSPDEGLKVHALVRIKLGLRKEENLAMWTGKVGKVTKEG